MNSDEIALYSYNFTIAKSFLYTFFIVILEKELINKYIEKVNGFLYNIICCLHHCFMNGENFMEKPKIKDIVLVWWRFFWRYAIVFSTFLCLGGLLLNLLNSYNLVLPQGIYFAILFYGFFSNLIASLVVFYYIFGREFKKSPYILALPSSNFKTLAIFLSWGNYFLHFILMAIAISFFLGALFPFIVKFLGYDPLIFLKYSKYLGNFAVLPASFISFLILMWRKDEKKRKLIILKKASSGHTL